MHGGNAIAAGTQGCIFLPKLLLEKDGNRRVHARNSTNTTKITKIFYDKDTYKNELSLLRIVQKITGGLGVIDYDPTQMDNRIDVLNSEIPSHLKSACSIIQQALARDEPVYTMNQTKVLGSINFLPDKSNSLSFFKVGFEALLKLVTHNIVHLDIAQRNIFYTKDNAIIGDFGYGFDMTIDNQFDTNLDRFFNKHMISRSDATPVEKILDCFSLVRDNISYEASFALYFYKYWSQKEQLIDAFFNDSQVKNTINDIYKPFMDDVEPGYFEKIIAIMEFIRDEVHTQNEMKEILKDMLRHSDLQSYIRSIFPKLNISKNDITSLRRKCIVNNNYDFFYELLNEKPTKDIANLLSLIDSGVLVELTDKTMSLAESATQNRMAKFPYEKVNKYGGKINTRRYKNKRKYRKTMKV